MKQTAHMIFRWTFSTVAVALVAVPAYAAPILNGSFEVPGAGSNFVTYTTGGEPAGFEWDVVGSIDHIGSLWEAAEGVQSVDLIAASFTGGVSQIVNLDPGDYELRFAMAGNTAGGTPVKSMSVAVAGGGIAADVYTFDTTGRGFQDMGWVYHTLPFSVLLALPTTFTFLSADNACCYGAALDDVSINAINAVPEPATMLLLGSGAVALLARRRIRARR